MPTSSHSDSKTLIRKNSTLARWAIPTSIVAFLAVIFSFIFLPFGIVLFLAALIMIGANVLRKEDPSDDLSEPGVGDT